MIGFFVGLFLGSILGAAALAAYALYIIDVTTTSVAASRARGDW